LTAPFVPLLFAGEEWGASSPFLYFTDHQDAALGDAVREGRRRELAAFGWRPEDVPDPQAEETFRRSKLRWEERDAPGHAALLDWHRRLIAFRRATPALTDGRLDAVRVRVDEPARWLTMTRGPVSVACNFGPDPVRVPVAGGAIRLASAAGCRMAGAEVVLPGESVAILA
jgi:maltooligosyltrehalose trehalohydrolase